MGRFGYEHGRPFPGRIWYRWVCQQCGAKGMWEPTRLSARTRAREDHAGYGKDCPNR